MRHVLSNFQPLVTQEQFNQLVDLASNVYDISTCLGDLAVWSEASLPSSTAGDCAPVGQDIVNLVSQFKPQPVS